MKPFQPPTQRVFHFLIIVAMLSLHGERPSLDAQTAAGTEPTRPTAKRIREKGWWPTRPDAARNQFAGTEACVPCHKQKVVEQQQTPMAHAAWRASETEVLRSMAVISNSSPPFKTEILRDSRDSTYTVARGGLAMSGQVFWSMGDGQMGQTFVLQTGGHLYESQLSFFRAIKGLDLTPGHTPASPQDLEHAFGLTQTTETAQQCFGCHTTGSSQRGNFEPAHATPGVTCEACHGPGAIHVKAMQEKQDDSGQAAMLDPRSFGPVKMVDFCGACHRAPLDVTGVESSLPINIRFQPYRLSKSRCWSQPDRRITCVACHNPHQDLVRETGFYDEKCLACHASTPVAAPAASEPQPIVAKPAICPVGTHDCVSCHMPKYRVPQMHGSFTDHDIRVVRPADPFPL
jgi:hypothetical protein